MYFIRSVLYYIFIILYFEKDYFIMFTKKRIKTWSDA